MHCNEVVTQKFYFNNLDEAFAFLKTLPIADHIPQELRTDYLNDFVTCYLTRSPADKDGKIHNFTQGFAIPMGLRFIRNKLILCDINGDYIGS